MQQYGNGRIAKALKVLNLYLFGISNIDTDTRKKMFSSMIKKQFLFMLDDMWRPLYLKQEFGVQFWVYKARKVLLSIDNKDMELIEVKVSIKLEPLLMNKQCDFFERTPFKGDNVA
jgi:hypothetical protein